VDRPAADAVGRLAASGVTVVRNAGWFLLAVADATQRQELNRMGVPYRVIDWTTRDKSYFTVARVRPDRADVLRREARVVFLEGGVAVVEAPAGSADRLAQSGFDIQRVFMRPVTPPRATTAGQIGRSPGQANPLVVDMVEAVDGPTIDGYVQRLQDFVTRWAWHSNDSCQAAIDWITAEFTAFGLDSVEYQDFSPYYKGNVVAVLPGTTHPEQVVVVGGHYDSTSGDAITAAPGADDNASGTAGVLECARILSQYRFEKTIVFIAFGAEEQGLDGSEYYAAQASAGGEDIVAMVNLDMIGYLAPGDDLDVDVVSNAASAWLSDRAMAVAADYVPETPAVDGSLPSGRWSDHMSFWDHGYPAILLWEDTGDSSPYIHTAADTIGLSYNHPGLAEQTTKIVVALLAELAAPIGGDIGPPASMSLEQNAPNPFNPRTMIRFTIPPPGERASLRVYDVAGHEVIALVDGEVVSGTKTVWWNGTGAGGRPVASGVYFYRLTAGGQTLTKKLVLVR
jgi:hypothetical protein